MKRKTPVSAVAVAGRSSRKRRCASARHLHTRVPDREEMSALRSWSGTNLRAGDSVHVMRSAGSTVRPVQATNAQTSRYQCDGKDRIMNTHICTPRLKNTGERLRLGLNDADWVVANRYRGTLRVKGIVTDQKTGKRYRIKGAACGLQCCCDATAEEI